MSFHTLFFIIWQQLVFNILLSHQKERQLKWTSCGNCNDSLSGSKEVLTTCHLVNENNTTIMKGEMYFSIPFDDSLLVDWMLHRSDDHQKLINVKFRRACSDSILFVGGRWRDMWQDMPKKCPISKGMYKLKEIDPAHLLKHQLLFLPSGFERRGISFYSYGKFFKKRTGFVVGCVYISFRLD